jgi:DNA-binding MarR family transcriptional regulator
MAGSEGNGGSAAMGSMDGRVLWTEDWRWRREAGDRARPPAPEQRREGDPDVSASEDTVAVVVRIPRSQLAPERTSPLDQTSHVELARQIYRIRRLRNRLLDDRLFQDPSWDMLLELFQAHHKSRTVTVTTVCAAADAPATTALRALNRLEEFGYAVRVRDPKDKRRLLVRLTAKGLAQMTQLFVEIMATPEGER